MQAILFGVMRVICGGMFVALVSATTMAQQAATPVLSPGAGSYASGQMVTITDATPGATLYYAVHGVTPTAASTLYTGPFAVSGTETVKAIAVAGGFTQSAVASATYTAVSAAATPVLTPAAGTYAAGQTVTIADATPGATIHYAVHGVVPTSASPVYTGPIAVSGTETVKAIAIATGYTQSAVVAATYTVLGPPAAVPVFSPAAGTYPATQLVRLTDATAGATIYYATHGAVPTTASTRYTGPFSVSGTETLKAIAVGSTTSESVVATAKYTMELTAATPVFTPGPGTYAVGQTVAISDAAGMAAIRYTADGTTATATSHVYPGPVKLAKNTTLSAIAIPGGELPSQVASGVYMIQTATPVITPSGGTLLTTYSVTISDATAGSAIYYTVDGTTPTTGSTLYPSTGAEFTATASETVKAIAVSSGFATSLVGSASFTIAAPPQMIYGVAGNGTPGYTGDGGQAAQATLNRPEGLALDSAGNLYIADSRNNVVRRISSAGVITTVAGNGTAAYAGDGGLATSASLSGPGDVAIDSKGNMFIADSGNSCVRRVDATTGKISTFAGTGTYTLYPDTTVSGVATSTGLAAPVGVTTDAENNVYIDDQNNSRVYKVEASTGYLTTVVGDGGSEEVLSGQTGTPALGSDLYFPVGVRIGPSGELYVANTSGNQINRVDLTASLIYEAAGDGYNPDLGHTGDGGPAIGASLASPSEMALDKNGNLYLTDSGSNTIRQVSASTGIIVTIAGIGAPDYRPPNSGYSGDGGLALDAKLDSPEGIIVAPDGTVYISDTLNNAVRKITGLNNMADAARGRKLAASGALAGAGRVQ